MDDDEAERVGEWNRGLFGTLGFNLQQAEALVRAGADPHDLERVLANGCPLDTALLIYL